MTPPSRGKEETAKTCKGEVKGWRVEMGGGGKPDLSHLAYSHHYWGSGSSAQGASTGGAGADGTFEGFYYYPCYDGMGCRECNTFVAKLCVALGQVFIAFHEDVWSREQMEQPA